MNHFNHVNHPTQLERTIQFGLLVIVALMPFHAFFSVWLGSLTHHQAIIQAWKEALLVILSLLSIVLAWREPARLQRLRQPWTLLAAAFALIALIVTAATRPSAVATAFGLKTDLEFLVAAVIALLVATPVFTRQLVTVVVTGAGAVIAFGLLQIYALPPDFLTHFGYGPSTILPYEHIEQGVAALRFPSTLGGPNQLGTYLILPLCLAVPRLLKNRLWLLYEAGGLLVLWGTYSRGAWIGAVSAIVLTWTVAMRGRIRRSLAAGLTVTGLVLLVAITILALHSQLQAYIFHGNATGGPSSDSQHALSLRTGLHDLLSAPLGHGLGTAGPATFHTGAGNILEDYYLQTGYETGILGMITFMALIVALLISLRDRLAHPAALPVAAAIVGVSLVALVLPSWVDSSTALVTFTAAGALAGLQPDKSRV